MARRHWLVLFPFRLALVGLISCCVARSAAAEPLDHFRCYRAVKAKPAKGKPPFPMFMPRTGETVVDFFGESILDIERPVAICNPVDVNGNDPSAPAHSTHLVAYETSLTRTMPGQPKLPQGIHQVRNQFGELKLGVRLVSRLFVPSTKLPGPGGSPLNGFGSIGRFNCYRVVVAKASPGSPAFPEFSPVTVELTDHFGGPLTHEVVRPTRLCSPVIGDGDELSATSPGGVLDHLLCYATHLEPQKPAQPKFAKTTVSTSDEFGDEVLNALSPGELCVPSTVEIEPSPTPTATPAPTPRPTPTSNPTATPSPAPTRTPPRLACGDTVIADTQLEEDLINCTGIGLRVAEDVVLDCAGHTISGSGGLYGILLDDVSDALVRDCRVRGFDRGIRLFAGARNHLAGNEIFDNQTYGIDLAGESAANLIENNLIRDNRDEGIHVGEDANRNQIFDNQILRSAVENVYLLSAKSCEIKGNLIAGAGSASIFVKHSDNNEFDGNQITDALIQVRGASAGNRFRGNLLAGVGFKFEAFDDPNLGCTFPHNNRVEGGSILDVNVCFEFNGAYRNQATAVLANGCTPKEESALCGQEPEDNVVELIDLP